MTNNFKKPQPGTDPLASDVGQFALAFSGQADVGTLSLVPPQTTPSAPAVTETGTGNLNGNYHWIVVLITGWEQSDGSYYVNGFAPSVESAQVAVANAQGSIPLPLGGAGTIGRAIYRTQTGGISGSEKFSAIVWDNTTTTYLDNTLDGNLGTGMPTSSTTPAVYGTPIPSTVPTTNTTGTTLEGGVNTGSANTWTGTQTFSDIDITNTASAGLHIYETDTSGNAKHIRVSSDELSIMNSAQTASVWQVDDSGNVTQPSGASTSVDKLKAPSNANNRVLLWNGSAYVDPLKYQ